MIIVTGLSILFLILMIHGMPLFGVLGGFGLILIFAAKGEEGGTEADPFSYAEAFDLDNFIGNFQAPMVEFTSNELLFPIAIFTLVGFILANSQAPTRIVMAFRFFTQSFLGKSTAALGILTLIVSAFFTPLTGASGVTIIALGGLLYPILKQQSYPDKLSLGIITAGGSIGLLFFPSLPVFIYALISGVNVREMFFAGLIPGVILILIPSIANIFKTRKLETNNEKLFWKDVKDHVPKFFAEVSILLVLGVLFMTGVATITDMATIALLYYIVLEIFLFKEIDFKQLVKMCEEAFALIGGILIIVFCSKAMSDALIDMKVSESLFKWMKGFIHEPWQFLLVLNIFLLIVGALMDIFSAILVVAPLIIPLGIMYEIDMLHLGILFLCNLEIGYLTPPMGINLFIASFRFKKPLISVYKAITPFLISLIVVQVLITFIPKLSLWYRDLSCPTLPVESKRIKIVTGIDKDKYIQCYPIMKKLSTDIANGDIEVEDEYEEDMDEEKSNKKSKKKKK